jgi:hypothetical protein
MTAPMDGLDRAANAAFAGRVVRKNLVREVKVGSMVLIKGETKPEAEVVDG